MHAFVAPEAVEQARKEWVLMPVVERDVGRRADYSHDAFAIDAERIEHSRVRLKMSEVVLLFQTWIARELRRMHSIAAESLRRNGLWNEHALGRPAAELVLERREFVVEGRPAGNAERPSGESQMV